MDIDDNVILQHKFRVMVALFCNCDTNYNVLIHAYLNST